jgi:hypothetical protein
MPGKITTLVVEHTSGENIKTVDVKYTDDGCTIALYNSETKTLEDSLTLDHTQISIVVACLQANGFNF